MGERAARRRYLFIKKTLDLLYPRISLEGTEHIPAEAVIFVGNHCQTHGPLVGELRMPVERKTWCAAEMMDRSQVADYAYRDFWSQNAKWKQPFYKLLSHAIVPLAVLLFNQAETIPVYRDNRVLSTFRATIQTLEAGKSVVIFPEHDQRCNPILDDFQDHFIDTARLWHRRTGKRLAFVPMYLCPALHRLCFGTPIRFDPERPMDEERQRIKTELMDSITAMAEALPRHRVVPYRPQPRKFWHYNRSKEE